MKHRAPWPVPMSSSLGLRVRMGQNSSNRVGFSMGVAQSSGVRAGGGGASATGGGPLRGPLKFSCELQNSVSKVDK